MDEKSETKSGPLPASCAEAKKTETAGTPEARPGGGGNVIASRRFLFLGAALLVLVIAAASVSLTLYLSSRAASRTDQKVLYDAFQQSLRRMERQLAASDAHAAGGSAAGESAARSAPQTAGLLDAANLRYREGQFKEAAVAYRTAMGMDSGRSFNDETHYRYAQCLLQTGSLDGALLEFQTVETGYPGSPYFASAATEAARLFYQKKSYAQARRVLYELIAARDRLSAADKICVERACFSVAQCYEAEAESLDVSRLPSPAAEVRVAPPPHDASAPAAPPGPSAPVARADNLKYPEGK